MVQATQHRKKNSEKLQLDYFLSELRKAIRKDIAEFKASKKTDKGWVSDFSGYKITDNKKVTVDHIYPKTFRRLAYDWIKSRAIDLNEIDFLTDLEFKALLKDWREFHRKNCELQIVSESQNKHLWFSNRANDIPYTRFYTN
jgi:hypothetical protein